MRMRYGRWTAIPALLVILAACSSEAEPEKAVPPGVVAVTAVGAPIGAPVSATIDSAGGTVVSADGKLTLIVPADAVSEATEFSVTAIEPTSPGGLVSYRLGPDGGTFANKVTVRFKYSEADVVGSHAAFFRIAYQDAERRWLSPVTLLDESAQTVSAQTDHLSDWSLVRGKQIRPASAVVAVKESVRFTVQNCDIDRDPDVFPAAYDCQEYSDDVTPILYAASVNGVVGGNATLGRVTAGPSMYYTAPNKVPSPNPVTVSVDMHHRESGNRMSKTVLLAQVTVVSEDNTAPEDTFPQRYTGSGTISHTSGGEGSAVSLLKYSATYEIAGNRSEGGGTGDYTLSGTLTITDGEVALPNCQCTITGGSGAAEAGLGISESPNTQYFSLSAFTTVGISCTPSEGRRSCPSSYVIPVSSSNNPVPQCTGSTVTTFTNVREVTGSYQRTCGSTNETANWTLIGE